MYIQRPEIYSIDKQCYRFEVWRIFITMETKKLVVFGYGQRGRGYAAFAKTHPAKFALAAIIEINEEKIQAAKEQHPGVPIFTDYREFLRQKISADVVAVATQDEQHKEHAIGMMEAGYHLLLEKPISNNIADCRAIYQASKKYDRKVVVCHVLRYTPYYSTIKKYIDDGELGEIVTIHASENVGYYHQAHSFVRGPWRNSKESSPMILAKCCHDMDIIRYLMGERCLSINSYGGLYYFNEKNAPKGCAQYCSECKYENCPYNAQKLYTMPHIKEFAGYFTLKVEDEEIIKELKGTQYDKCVFKTDNDVVDHQVTVMQFENGKTACHTMTAFSKEIYRDIKIHGTKAELVGVIESNKFEIRYFGGETKEVNVDLSAVDVGGHGGGDYYLMNGLYELLNGKEVAGISYLDVSLESHLMSLNAEESRLQNGKTIKIEI